MTTDPPAREAKVVSKALAMAGPAWALRPVGSAVLALARALGMPLLIWSLVAAGLAFTQGPSRFELGTPWLYLGDALLEGLTVKSVIDTGWAPWYQPFLGAPSGTSMLDYAGADGASILLVRLLAIASGDWVTVTNVFYLLGFFLAATSGYWVLRQMGLQRELAALGGLLFAFAPYHFLRPPHFFLTAYFALPLGVWLAMWSWNAVSPLGHRAAPVAVGTAVILCGSTGIYYAFFSCAVISLAALAACVSPGRRGACRRAAIAIGGICVVVAANLTPSFIHTWKNGPNPAVAKRHPFETELYGLKMAQLMLPHPSHRIDALAKVGQRYNSGGILTNENVTSSLGVLGVIGLLAIFVRAFIRLSHPAGGPTIADRVGWLAISLIAFATVGGFATLFALLVSPSLRAVNRVSILVAFLAIASLMLLLKRALAGRSRALSLALCAGLGTFGMWEQSTPMRRMGVETFYSDRDFVRRLEASLPQGAGVYQLPYHRFPESGPQNRMEDYSLLRGYLHSSRLRWSYGATKGRPEDEWQRANSQKPLREAMSAARAAGFAAVYLDRRAFADDALHQDLTEILGKPMLTSVDGQLAAWTLEPGVRPPMEPDDYARPVVFSRNLFPPYVARTEGLSGAEPWGRWTEGPVLRIDFTQPLPRQFRLVLRTMDAFGANASQRFTLIAGNAEQQFSVGHGDREVSLDVATTGDVSTLVIHIPDPRSPKELGTGADPRRLGLALRSLQIVPVAGKP